MNFMLHCYWKITFFIVILHHALMHHFHSQQHVPSGSTGSQVLGAACFYCKDD